MVPLVANDTIGNSERFSAANGIIGANLPLVETLVPMVPLVVQMVPLLSPIMSTVI